MNCKHITAFLALMIILGACAKVVAPTGGPKDTTPPKVLKEVPVNGSVRLKEPVVKVTFDEYFTLNNPTDNVLISPPLQEQPHFNVNGKTMVIKFKEELRPNTTYNLVFSNCIQDYHESNKLSYYHYSFSTGDIIDTFMLAGKVNMAGTLEPGEDLFVFLYDQDVDSLPMTTRPTYLTKTQKDGSFAFHNVQPGDYKVFALKDLNANLLYDLPDESVAFVSGTVASYPEPKRDTTAKRDATTTTALPKLDLFAFVAPAAEPTLLRYENPAVGIYKFPYKSAVEQFTATPLERDVPHFQTINKSMDTITWYLKETLNDTLEYAFIADGHSDTVRISPFKAKKGPAPRGGARNTNAPSLAISVLNQGHRFKPITLAFSYPAMPTDSIDILFISHHKSDTDTVVCRTAVPDSLVTRLPLTVQLEDKKNYTMIIPDSVFQGYNGGYNDSIKSTFTQKTQKDYGSLIMEYSMEKAKCQYIIQLWNGATMIQEDILTKTATISYLGLDPGGYSIRAIEDRNNNGRWDAGDYRTGLQPERIISYPSVINIRAFWENEESFNLTEE
ncbi:MAG: Ig-like domain-containing protein [Bacteroidales bacterium]|nr:Ig-like domain-containing protein [Bacteroidales bacterium]